MALPADDLPMLEPRWQRRRITAAEVLQLARDDDVPGVNPDDPTVTGLRRARLDNIARSDLGDALRRGYLYVRDQHHAGLGGTDQRANLRFVWWTWCIAAGHPDIAIVANRATDAYDVRVDVSTTGREWELPAFTTIARMLQRIVPADRAARWLFTPDQLDIDCLAMDDALVVARSLVTFATGGRYESHPAAGPWTPEPMRAHFPDHLPIERHDRRD